MLETYAKIKQYFFGKPEEITRNPKIHIVDISSSLSKYSRAKAYEQIEENHTRQLEKIASESDDIWLP